MKTLHKTILVDIKLKTGEILHAGTQVKICWDSTKTKHAIVKQNNTEYKLRNSSLNKYFGAPFKKAPTPNKLQQWSNDGVCQTVLGTKTEPDGYGNYGEPSWLLIFGMI